jgi:hypothetical protein
MLLLLRPKTKHAMFAWLISHQPTVLFSQNKSATSNPPTVLFSQNKPAPTISHQRTGCLFARSKWCKKLDYQDDGICL